MRIETVFIIAAALCTVTTASGQRLYRQELDAAAQQAVKAMERVDSKALFERMLDNLGAQSKTDFNTAFSAIRLEARARIQQWDDWCSVHSEVVRVMTDLGYAGLAKTDPLAAIRNAGDAASAEEGLRQACRSLLVINESHPSRDATQREWNARLADLKAAREALQTQIDSLRTEVATGSSSAQVLLDRIDQIEGIRHGLSQISALPAGAWLKRLSEPASTAIDLTKLLGAAYGDFEANRKSIDNVRQDLRELRAEMLKISVLKLAAEEEHLKRLLAIEVRSAQEMQQAADSFEEYRVALLCEQRRDADIDIRRIADSLQQLGSHAASSTAPLSEVYRLTAKQGAIESEAAMLTFCAENPMPPQLRLIRLARAIYNAASVEARGRTPKYFAELRRAQEHQRYSIVRSAVEARSYETLVDTGVRRLAMLHAGGVKPSQVASLAFNAAQVAGIGVIAVKQ